MRISDHGTANILVAVMVVATFGLYVFQLGQAAFWHDEGHTWALTQAADPHRWHNDARHPMLYYTLLNVWVGWFGGSEFSLRLPSVIFFALTIPVVYAIGRLIHSPRAGLYAALLLASSPFMFDHARDARSYAMLAFTCSVAFYCLAGLLKERTMFFIGSSVALRISGSSWDRQRVKHDLLWAGLTASVLVAMLTHFITLLLPLITLTILVAGVLSRPAGQRKQFIINILVAHALITIAWLAHPDGLAQFLASAMGTGFAPGLLTKLAELTGVWGSWPLQPAVVLPVGCVMLGLWHWYRQREWKWLAFVLVGWLAAPTISTVSEIVIQPTLRSYSFIWTVVPFYVAIGAGLCWVGRRWLMASLLGLLLLFNAFGTVMEYRATEAPWDVIIGDLVNRAEEGDGFLRCSGPLSALKPYHQGLEVPGAYRYHRDKEGTIQPSGLTQHDRLWVLDWDDGCGRRGHLEALRQEWSIEVYEHRLEYGAGEVGVWLGKHLHSYAVGQRADYRGSLTLYGLEKPTPSSRLQEYRASQPVVMMADDSMP